MKLSQAKPFCIFNHHNGSIWHIHANFHYCCGYQNLDFVFLKFLHDSIFLIRFHFSVQHTNFDIGWKNLLKLRRIIQHVFAFCQFTFFHQRTNDIHLMSGTNLFFHKFICCLAIGRIHHTVFDRQPLRRNFIDHGNIQITI